MQKIFGTAFDKLRNAPVQGLKIRAWDEDLAGGDDLMGEDITGQDGRYEIKYEDAYWDAKIPGFTTWRPDIYITADIRNKDNKWVRLGRSNMFKDHPLELDLRIDLNVRIEPLESRKTVFNPQNDGFHFVNSFKFKPELLGLDFEEKGMGFCGGMCGAALYRFKKSIPVPIGSDVPPQGAALYAELLKRQIKSMDPMVIARMFEFQSAPDQVDAYRKTSIGELTRSEWPKLKDELDKGRPAILVLIRARKLFDNPTKNHQTLAIGYEYDPTRKDLLVYEYDPNKPGEMQTLEMNLGLPDGKLYLKDSAYRGTRGFFVNQAGAKASRKMS